MDIQTKLLEWKNNPPQFVHDAFGVNPSEWQAEALGKLASEDYLAIRSGHGVGKSAFLSWAILWFISTRYPCKIPCTAPTGHQLNDILWSELGIWLGMMDEQLKSQYNLNTERLSLKGYENASFAVARTARKENPDAFQGFHSKNLMFVCDEASGIDDKIFEVGEGAMSTPGAKTIMTGNPTRTSGYFYDAFHKMADFWWTRKVSCLDVHAEYANPAYAERVAAKWGRDSNVYRVRVMGDFPSENEDAVIPYYLVEEAISRDVDPIEGIMPVWGLDVARFGNDKTALCKRKGNTVTEKIKTWRKKDTMEVCGLVLAEWEDCKSDMRPVEILVDVIGVGAGVVDRLKELGLPVRAINVGESAASRERFMRLRDELWWKAREWFERRDVKMPDDEELVGQLTSVGYDVTSNSKIKVWSKDQIREAGMDSPDLADAFCLTMAGTDRRGNPERYHFSEDRARRRRHRKSSWYTR